jgi:hypothetical protein
MWTPGNHPASTLGSGQRRSPSLPVDAVERGTTRSRADARTRPRQLHTPPGILGQPPSILRLTAGLPLIGLISRALELNVKRARTGVLIQTRPSLEPRDLARDMINETANI